MSAIVLLAYRGGRPSIPTSSRTRAAMSSGAGNGGCER